MMYKLFVFGFFLVQLQACSTRTCKPGETIENKASLSALEKNPPVMGEPTKASEFMQNNTVKKIKVYKPDGSIQCEPGTGISPTEMAKQLSGLKIYSSQSQHDGLMRIQVCGQPTGQCNVYEIAETDLATATQAGFKIWK